MLRKLLLALGVALGLVALAVVALLLFVDVNRFKPRIEQAASDTLKRKLVIDGDLKLALLPRIAVELPATRLNERDAERTFVALKSARIAVELLPLLRGRIEAGPIRIDGLNATIERRKDGSSNIDDLLGGRGNKPPETADGPAGTPQFNVGGLQLRDAQFTLIDAGRPLLQLSRLNLSTGPLAPRMRTKVELEADFAAPQSKASGHAQFGASLDLDLPSKQYAAQTLAGTLSGKLDAGSFEIALNAPQLAFGPTTRGEKLILKAKLGGTQSLDATLELSGFSGSAQEVAVQALALTANAQQGARRIVAQLGGPAQFAVEPQTLRLAKLSGALTLDDPALPQKTVKLPLDAAVALDAKKQLVNASLNTRFDDTTLSVKAAVAGFDKPRIGFDLQADKFNLDRYLPPAKESAGQGAAGGAEEKIDLAALRDLNLTGQVRVGQLQARGLKTSDLRLAVKAAGGRVEVAPLSAQLYGGTLNGTASVAADGNRVGLNASLANVDIDPLLRDALDKELLEGRGNVKLNLATAGATASAMKRALDGTAAIALRDGAIKGINVAQKLRQAQALLGRGGADSARADLSQKTDFSELSASFAIRNGVAVNNDLDMKSPLLRLGGGGRIDIGAGALDYTAKVSVVGTLKGQDGRDISQLRGVTVPLRLHGPFEQLQYTIDWAGVAQEALKSRAREELEKRLAPKLDEKTRDVLKGLLGR